MVCRNFRDSPNGEKNNVVPVRVLLQGNMTLQLEQLSVSGHVTAMESVLSVGKRQGRYWLAECCLRSLSNWYRVGLFA